VQLVKRGPAAQGQFGGKLRIPEDGCECAGEHEILLDLFVGGPARLRTPLRDEIDRDHSSTSMAALTWIFHLALCFDTAPEPCGSRRATPGLRARTIPAKPRLSPG